jgi:proline iminopeptidase
VNAGFFKKDGQLIENATVLKNIPGVIVQGRYDMVCPAITAWDLHKVWPESELKMISDAGHSMKEPGILSALVEAADKYKNL